jgi:ATP-binding cassette subfamily B protein
MKFRTKDTLKIYWQHMSKYPWVLFGLVTATIMTVFVNSYYPFVYKKLINFISSPEFDLSSALSYVWLILGLSLINVILWRIAIFSVNYFQPRVKSDLINSCYSYLQDHSFNFFTNSFAGSLVKRIGRFERSFEDIMDKVLFHIGRIFIRVLIVVCVFIFLNPIVGAVMVGWAIIFVFSAFFFARFKLKYDLAVSEADSTVSGFLADTVVNNSNIKMFGGIKKELSSLKNLTQILFRKRKLSWDINQINEGAQSILMVGLEFFLMYYSVKLLKQGEITVGDIVLVQTFMVQVFSDIWDLGRYIRDIYERLADASEMTEIFLTPHEVTDKPNASKLSVTAGVIDFQNIKFQYSGGREVLSDFNLSVRSGEKVALVGPSGGGKTTIVKLLLRLFDLTEGKITIDNQDISAVTQESLRDNLVLVPQETILFHRSLYDNIAYARPTASREEVINASKLAHCHEFITQLKDGYNTFVGERGIKLSGGERQRVAIARAILKNALILVLDEATSSLDSESETLIQDALLNLMKDRTTLVIAHRLSTIMKMDRIVVIEDGKIKEEGQHSELLKVKKGIYQKLWGIQAGGFAK